MYVLSFVCERWEVICKIVIDLNAMELSSAVVAIYDVMIILMTWCIWMKKVMVQGVFSKLHYLGDHSFISLAEPVIVKHQR